MDIFNNNISVREMFLEHGPRVQYNGFIHDRVDSRKVDRKKG